MYAVVLNAKGVAGQYTKGSDSCFPFCHDH